MPDCQLYSAFQVLLMTKGSRCDESCKLGHLHEHSRKVGQTCSLTTAPPQIKVRDTQSSMSVSDVLWRQICERGLPAALTPLQLF